MIDLSKYRIKTKKEFLAEFGEDWRNKLGFLFNRAMDFLCGMPLTKIKFDEHFKTAQKWVEIGDPMDDIMIESPLNGYFITRVMVTDKPLPSDKPKPKVWYESGHDCDIEMNVSGRDTSVTIWFDNKSFEGRARTHEGEQNVPAVGFIVALSRAVEKAKKVLGRIPAVHNVFDDKD